MKSDGKLPKIWISRLWVSRVFLNRSKRDFGGGVGFGQPGADAGAAFLGERAADAAGHGPGGMDFLAAEDLDDFLAELAEADAGAGEVGVGGDEAEDVALGRRGVPAEEEVRRAEVEEAQGMALDDLAEVHQPAQLVGGGRDVDGHDGVAGLGGGEQVADGADAADARGDAGHFGVRAGLRRISRSRGTRRRGTRRRRRCRRRPGRC